QPQVAGAARRRRGFTVVRAIASLSSTGLDGNARASCWRRCRAEAGGGATLVVGAGRGVRRRRRTARGSPALRARWVMAPSVPIGTPPSERLISASGRFRANALSTASASHIRFRPIMSVPTLPAPAPAPRAHGVPTPSLFHSISYYAYGAVNLKNYID